MSYQVTLRLPANLGKELDRTAKRLQRRRTQIVRMAVEKFLDAQVEPRPVRRVRDLLGRVESGIPDLGQRHREYLLKRLRNGK